MRLKISFQPSDVSAPPGHLVDSGRVFGNLGTDGDGRGRLGGVSWGWSGFPSYIRSHMSLARNRDGRDREHRGVRWTHTKTPECAGHAHEKP